MYFFYVFYNSWEDLYAYTGVVNKRYNRGEGGEALTCPSTQTTPSPRMFVPWFAVKFNPAFVLYTNNHF